MKIGNTENERKISKIKLAMKIIASAASMNEWQYQAAEEKRGGVMAYQHKAALCWRRNAHAARSRFTRRIGNRRRAASEAGMKESSINQSKMKG